VRWHGDYSDWQAASQNCPGYDAPQIVQNVLEKTLEVLNGQAAFERDGVTFAQPEYNWPALACILAGAEQVSAPLEVLDFGGSLGSFFHQHRNFFLGENRYHWHVVEQPHFVEIGKTRVHVTNLFFHDKIEDCLSQASPAFAYLSSVLQYLPDPWLVLDSISSSPISFLLIDRTPFTMGLRDRITKQHVSAKICKSNYPCRFFSKSIFLKRLDVEWELIADWADTIDRCNLIDCEFRGIFLKKRNV
jgi:putative methyltransferase (TIGR04325 family)